MVQNCLRHMQRPMQIDLPRLVLVLSSVHDGGNRCQVHQAVGRGFRHHAGNRTGIAHIRVGCQ